MSFDPRPRASVVSVRPAVNGVFATLACHDCGARFERYQPELAGVHVGAHPCPACGAEALVTPAGFAAAIREHLADLDVEQMFALTTEASRVARAWYRAPDVAALLRHRGVELGPPMELYLVPIVVGGLLAGARGR